MEKSDILLILFIGMIAISLTFASGKYDIMAPTNLEIEENPQLSCSQGDGTTGSCHMINATFGGLMSGKNGPGPDGVYDRIQDYKVYNNQGPFAGSGVPHPGSGRVPASTFPRWVHMQHGDGNWPLWKAGPDAPPKNKGTIMEIYRGFDTNNASALWYSLNDEYDYPLDWDYLISPITGSNTGGTGISPTILNGTSDQNAGDAVGTDLGPFRFPYGADDGVTYWGDPNNIIMGESNTGVIEGLGYIATPGGSEWKDNDGDGIFETESLKYGPSDNRGPPTFAGCAYGVQPDYSIVKGGTPDKAYNSSEPSRYGNYNRGCHGISQSWMAKNIIGANFTRTDSPACTDCHNTVTAANFNHRTIDPATNCATCHKVGGTTLSAANGVPEVRDCYECHTTGLKISPTVNTTYAHAGVDCRYCHGHGHNVTIQDVGGSGYGVTCGSGDNSCHGAGAPAPRNVGNIQHGQTVTKSCVDCHVTATGSASGHDIRIPACSDCHTSTGVGGKSAAAQPVPSWDSNNAIYHGNANKTCQNCHGVSSPHDNTITASTPSCNQAGCHDGSATGARNVTQVHAANVTGGGNLTCLSCHNNVSIVYNGTTYYPNASIHSTNDTKLIPFGMGYGNDNMTPSECVKCHSSSDFYQQDGVTPLNCADCHSSSNAYGVKALTVHSVDMNQPGANIDGKHKTAGPDCRSCHDLGGSAPKHINFTALQNGVHGNINTTSTTGYEVNEPCYACHSSNGQPPDGHPDKQKTPFVCTDCHLSTGVKAGAYGAPMVSEHYLNGSELVATTGANTALKSCLNCHQNPNISELRIINVNDPDNGSFDADGDGVYGGNLSAYHYGKISPVLNNSGVANCVYCHQQNSSFDLVMQDATHNNMLNHTDNVGGPGCADCHGSGRMHDESLTKPVLTPTNNTLCMTCHTNKQLHNSAGNRAKNETVYCVNCHTGDINTVNVRDIHGIKYLNSSGKYEVWGTTSPASCTTCHRSNLGGKFANASQIPPLNHSDDPIAGQKWNKTSQTYWTPGDEQSACAFCHGDSRHRANALGNVSLIEDSLTRNTSNLSSTSWCAGCHFSQAANYNGSAFSPKVVNLSGWDLSNATDGTAYRDHLSRGYISNTSYSDSECRKCHGGLIGTSTTTREFVHRVAEGVSGGNNCISCHNLGELAWDVDFNATEDPNAAHRNLNSNVVTTLPAENKKCWACHTKDGLEPPSGDHPVGYNTPKLCEDCHTTGAFGAPLVKEHYKNGEDVKVTNAECYNCHSLGENQVSNLDYEMPSHYTSVDNNKSYASHYVMKRDDLKAKKDESYCGYCHQQHKSGTTSSAYNQFFTNTNRTVQPDHSARSRRYYAPCFKCHNSVNNLHTQSLTIPSYTSFDSECRTCHIPITSGRTHVSGMGCKLCHVGTTNKVHNVTYLTESGAYVPAKIAKQQKSYAKCYTCHVNSTLDALMSSYGYTNVVKVPFSGHGNGISADGSTTYWSDNYTACIFCHTSDHSENLPIGYAVRLAGIRSGDYPARINATIGSGTTTWCGSCHITSDSDYTLTVNYYFTRFYSKKPPVITPGTGNHSTLTAPYTDDKCATCHYGGSTNDGMDAFIHGIQ